MDYLQLNKQGYITNWLVAGAVCEPYTPPTNLEKTWENQLDYEKVLRNIFYEGSSVIPPEEVGIGLTSPLNTEWRYYYKNKNWFIDESTFYSLLSHIKIDAATTLVSDKMQKVDAIIWTYAAADLWLNGELIGGNPKPVYKPIQKIKVILDLKEGQNEIYVKMNNLGARDTRNILGIQIINPKGIQVALPKVGDLRPFIDAENWLSALKCINSTLEIPLVLNHPASLEIGGEIIKIENNKNIKLPPTCEEIKVCVDVNGQQLERKFQIMENIRPKYFQGEFENPIENVCRNVAKQDVVKRSAVINFSVYNVLARLAYNMSTSKDEAYLLDDLALVESRIDCADFLVIGLIRLVKNYPVSAKLEKRIKEVLLNFRYWMDENGSDGMCFWSENHALMFHGSQLLAGELYPDSIFTRSGRTGKEQFEKGADRCREWLSDVEKEGIEEFNSATYMPVTITALLNLIDFAPDDIAAMATKALDGILRQFSMHVFKNSIISPQGRVYRDVIYPHRQTAQGLLNLICPDFPYSTAEDMWYACFLTSGYQFPSDLKEIMDQPESKSYTSANVRIHIEKTKDYILTSVRSPREANDAPDWTNLCFVEGADKNTNKYVKSLNECFHGTSVIEPGVYGYQQHLWYGALSNECIVFVTNPGSSVDYDEMRPGYWYGNGVLPAVKQQKEVLGCIYNIPEEYPITFTHIFWPSMKFDKTIQDGNWIFGQLGDAWMALWCSHEIEKHHDVLTDCEYRCYSEKVAYYCVCGSSQTDKDINDFMTRCKNMNPKYIEQNNTLVAEDGYILSFEKHEDLTQYV